MSTYMRYSVRVLNWKASAIYEVAAICAAIQPDYKFAEVKSAPSPTVLFRFQAKAAAEEALTKIKELESKHSIVVSPTVRDNGPSPSRRTESEVDGYHWVVHIKPVPADYKGLESWVNETYPSSLVKLNPALSSVSIKFVKESHARSARKTLLERKYPVSALKHITPKPKPIVVQPAPVPTERKWRAWGIRFDDAPYAEPKMKTLETIARYAEPEVQICRPMPGTNFGFLNFVGKEAAEAAHKALTALGFRLRPLRESPPPVPRPVVPQPQPLWRCCTEGKCPTSPALTATQTEGKLGAGVKPVNEPVTNSPLGVSLGSASLGLYVRKYWLPVYPTLQMADDNLSVTWGASVGPDLAAQVQTVIVGEIQRLCADLTEIRQPFRPVAEELKQLVAAKAGKINAAGLKVACAAIEQPATENKHVVVELSCVFGTTDATARTAVVSAFDTLASAQKAATVPVPGVTVNDENVKLAASANCILMQQPPTSVPVLVTAFESMDVSLATESLARPQLIWLTLPHSWLAGAAGSSADSGAH